MQAGPKALRFRQWPCTRCTSSCGRPFKDGGPKKDFRGPRKLGLDLTIGQRSHVPFQGTTSISRSCGSGTDVGLDCSQHLVSTSSRIKCGTPGISLPFPWSPESIFCATSTASATIFTISGNSGCPQAQTSLTRGQQQVHSRFRCSKIGSHTSVTTSSSDLDSLPVGCRTQS